MKQSALNQSYTIRGGDFSKAGVVSVQIKNLLKELGLDFSVIRRAAIAAYEAEMNVIMYAREARVELSVSVGRIELVFEDSGPGIPDIGLAMREGYSTATQEMREMGFGAGMGLPNIKKNSDAFRITSKVGEGTRLEISISSNGRRA
jgi:anti-sigma regulatory factor (Ser/Thr protein kinase)